MEEILGGSHPQEMVFAGPVLRSRNSGVCGCPLVAARLSLRSADSSRRAEGADKVRHSKRCLRPRQSAPKHDTTNSEPDAIRGLDQTIQSLSAAAKANVDR